MFLLIQPGQTSCGLVVDVKTAKEMEKAIKKVYNEELIKEYFVL